MGVWNAEAETNFLSSTASSCKIGSGCWWTGSGISAKKTFVAFILDDDPRGAHHGCVSGG